MKTKFKASPTKKNNTKSVKWFSIKWGKVGSLKEYYKLKYPNLFKNKKTEFKKIKNYIDKPNFRNNQNYVVWDYIKSKLFINNKNILTNTFLFKFYYLTFTIFLIILWWSLQLHSKILFFYSSLILVLILWIALLNYIYTKIKIVKSNLFYSKLWKKFTSNKLFLRLLIKNKIDEKDFIITKK